MMRKHWPTRNTSTRKGLLKSHLFRVSHVNTRCNCYCSWSTHRQAASSVFLNPTKTKWWWNSGPRWKVTLRWLKKKEERLWKERGYSPLHSPPNPLTFLSERHICAAQFPQKTDFSDLVLLWALLKGYSVVMVTGKCGLNGISERQGGEKSVSVDVSLSKWILQLDTCSRDIEQKANKSVLPWQHVHVRLFIDSIYFFSPVFLVFFLYFKFTAGAFWIETTSKLFLTSGPFNKPCLCHCSDIYSWNAAYTTTVKRISALYTL